MLSIKTMARTLAVIAALAVLSGCSTLTQMEATTPGTTLEIHGSARIELPRSEDLKSKATGQYEFMATAPDGKKLYGLLPLNVNGGTMAMSILFFAPAMFIGGFRDVLPFYQVDVDNQVLNYKRKAGDPWSQYRPLEVESARAKAHFDRFK